MPGAPSEATREARLARRLLAPAAAAMLAVAAYPILAVFWLSLHHRQLTFNLSEFAGFANYSTLIADARFWKSLANTAYFSAVSVAIETALGLAIALVLHRSFPGRGWVRAAVLIPWAVPTVVSARMWEWIFHPAFGILNYLLKSAGLIDGNLNWLGSPFLAINAAILVDAWKTTPFTALILLAGLQSIPADLYRAARVDGAGPWKCFLHVTLPMLKPALLVAVLFRTLDAFRVFDVIYVLTGGGPANSTETLSIYAYRLLFQTLDFGYGSAVSMLTFVAVMLVSVFYIKLMARGSVA